MSPRALRACPRPGCPNLIGDGRQCANPEHRKRSWAPRASAAERGYARLVVPVPCARGGQAHATWASLRACVLERDGHRCADCGAAGATTVDHRRAKAQGGTDDEANLVACCARCQASKAGREGSAARQAVGR